VGPIAFEALVDTYYMFNFTGDPTRQPPALRAFDNQSNSFTLGYAKLAASMNADPVGFRIDLGYGHTASVINSTGFTGGTAGTPANTAAEIALYGDAFIVQQAYATANLFEHFLTLDAGKFVTGAGDEVIETKSNWNYSRGLLFNGIPFVHTGLRATVKLSDMLTLQGSVTNGWNNDPDNNGDKTYGGQLTLALPTGTNVIATTYIGKEGTNGVGDTRQLYDLVVAQSVGAVNLSFNFDFLKQGPSNWWGAALKARAGLTECFSLAGRFEFLQSKDGGYFGTLPTGKTSVYEGTLTGIVAIAKNYEMRFEGRGDFSNKQLFMNGTTPEKNQFTGTVGFLAWLP
jgi:hypothetical protein